MGFHLSPFHRRVSNLAAERVTAVKQDVAKDLYGLRPLVQEYLKYLADVRGCSPCTLKAYSCDLNQFRAFLSSGHGPMDVRLIQPRHVHLFMSWLGRSRSPRTIARKLNCVSGFLRHLCSLGIVERNAVDGIQRPRAPDNLPPVPDRAQCARLLAACDTPRERAVFSLLLGAGLRRGEALSLDLSDIDAGFTQLTVRRGKGGRSRTVPLSPMVAAAIQAYLPQNGREGGPLIVTSVGTRLGNTGLDRLFKRVVRRAGLADRGFSAHAMRHAFATHALRSGADLASLREILGHASLETTSRYLHADASTKASAVNAWAGSLETALQEVTDND